MAVALDLVLEGADHLAMAEIAALADVNVAARKLKRRVGPHAVHLFDGRFQVEQRRDLHEAADGDHEEDADEEERASISRKVRG